MNDFNLNEYQKYRQKKKKSAKRNHNLMVFAVIFSIILIVSSLTAILLVGGFFKRNEAPATGAPTTLPPESILPATSTETAKKTDDGIITVFIDAGRGCLASNGVFDSGVGTGSAYYELTGGKTESMLNLELALRLRSVLEGAGYRVIMMREAELSYGISLDHRVSVANKSTADVFVSIHASSGSPNDRGTRILYFDGREDGDKCLDLARSMAFYIDRGNGTLSYEKAKVETQKLAVCEKTTMPAIQIHTLYLTNEQDARMAMSETWQQNFTNAIASGIINQFPLN